ncbi:signal-regulatory protein beta-2-like [Epinephelus lanceolatus]
MLEVMVDESVTLPQMEPELSAIEQDDANLELTSPLHCSSPTPSSSSGQSHQTRPGKKKRDSNTELLAYLETADETQIAHIHSSGCTVNQIFETKTVGVGADVTLTCPRNSSGSIFWIRLVSGDIPKVLAKTYSFESDPRITATEEPGKFVLHIEKGKQSDTAVYLCVKIHQQNLTFLKGADVRVEGPEPDITTVTQDFPSDPVRPGDSVTLQCSVLSDSEKKSCPGNHSVFWFRAASDEFHPSAIYAYGNSAECEKSPEPHSPQKCVYSFSKSVSSSDAGTYYCAVATCGEILFGNGTKLDVEDISHCDSQNTVLFLVCAALALSLIVIAVLVHAIRTKSCDCSNGERRY